MGETREYITAYSRLALLSLAEFASASSGIRLHAPAANMLTGRALAVYESVSECVCV